MKTFFSTPCSLVIIISLCITSCHFKSDELLSLGQNDYQAFYEANNSFAGEFKTFWTAMNENYCIWDYEESLGLDWDEVYSVYLPKFEALDDTARHTPVTDDELKALYEQFTGSLHDGHLVMTVKNLHSGKYISLYPHHNRIMRERNQDMQEAADNITTLDVYRTQAADSRYRIKSYDGTGTDDMAFEFIDTTLQRAVRAADKYIALVEAAGGPDASNDSLFAAVLNMKTDAQRVLTLFSLPAGEINLMKNAIYQGYDKICNQYSFVGKQTGTPLVAVEKDILDDDLGSIRYALFEGNIAYLRIGAFGLTPHLTPSLRSADSTSMYFAYQQAVNRVWHHWFDTIQVLHKAGTLGGVILDVRNNNGGRLNDYQYMLGALLPSGGWDSHTLRIKNGIGRLDFAPLQPFTAPTYENEHEIINDRPVVVLANCRSISMAEMTTWGVKSQPNGCFIGVRTYGALNALSVAPENYSDMYSGAFGVRGVTPIWGYVPKLVSLFGKELKPLEGVGITPDKEVHLDVNMWMTQQRDNQLEAAIDYIR